MPYIFVVTGSLFFVFLLECAVAQVSPENSDGEGYRETSVSYTIQPAPEWTDLFHRTSGWFGADGIFSIPKQGIEAPGSSQHNESYFFFSDTMIGKAVKGRVFDYSTMVNNSAATLYGDSPDNEKIDFHWAEDEKGDPVSLFTPQTPNSNEGEYLWLGDGFVNTARNNQLYLFAYRIQRTDEGMGFRESGNIVIVIPPESEPPFENHRQIDTPLFIPGSEDDGYGSFGAGIFVNTEAAGAPFPDGYVYIYGVKGYDKELLAARVKPEDFEDFDRWKYRTQDGWNSDIHSAIAVTDRVSNELSVYPVSTGKYALIFQVDGIGSAVGMRMGESPAGPFGPIQELWDTKQVTSVDEDFYAYNAKAHPNLSKPGELLISYNVNSFDFLADLNSHPNLYRPRFIRLVFE